MAIINLRKHYYPLYTKDTFMEVPDEVAAVMEECRLYENRQEGRKKLLSRLLHGLQSRH